MGRRSDWEITVCVRDVPCISVPVATRHTQSWSLPALQLPPHPFSPPFCPTGLSGTLLLYSSAFLLSIQGSPISPLNPWSALHSDIFLLHSCKFLQTNWTAHADSLLTLGSPALWCPDWCHMSLPKCYLHNVVRSQKYERNPSTIWLCIPFTSGICPNSIYPTKSHFLCSCPVLSLWLSLLEFYSNSNYRKLNHFLVDFYSPPYC